MDLRRYTGYLTRFVGPRTILFTCSLGRNGNNARIQESLSRFRSRGAFTRMCRFDTSRKGFDGRARQEATRQ